MAFESDLATLVLDVLNVNLGQIVLAGAALLGIKWVADKLGFKKT